MPQQRSLFDGLDEPDTSGWSPAALPSLDGVDELELDCETRGLRWWEGDILLGTAIGLPGGRTQYLPIRHAGGNNIDVEQFRTWAQRELRDKKLYNLNCRYDNHVLYSFGVDLEAQGCTWSDVAHSAALLDDHRRHFSLELISQDLLGRGKVTGLNPEHMAEYTAGRVAPYAERDVELVAAIRAVQRPQLVEQELMRVQALEDEVIFSVCEMERNAAPLDTELLKRWVAESEQALLRTCWQIHRETGVMVEPSKSGDLARLYHALGIPITEFTPTGQPSFTDDVLSRCDHPNVVMARSARQLISLRSKYLVPYLASMWDGRLRYALHQLRSDEGGTVQGRFSASDRNIQQVMTPEKQREHYGDEYIVRELFTTADPTWLYLAADAEQIEFRQFVHFSGAQHLIKAYQDDPRVNFHKIIWAIFAPYCDISYKQLKNTNFAKLYGAGVAKVALMTGLGMNEAETVVRAYDRVVPDVRRMLNRASELAERRGYVKTLLGRRIRFPKKERLHKALNGVIQGSAADWMKMKLVELRRAVRAGVLQFIMRMTVHDEVTGDVPDQRNAELLGEILDRQTIPLTVPILWKVRTGRNWKEAA